MERFLSGPAATLYPRLILAALSVGLGGPTAAPAPDRFPGAQSLRERVAERARTVCEAGIEAPPVPGATRLSSDTFRGPQAQGEVVDWRVDDDVTLRVSRLVEAGQGRQMYFVDLYAPGADLTVPRPVVRGVIAGNCRFLGGRAVIYGAGTDSPLALERLGPDMRPSEPPMQLNPAVPAGAANPGCLRVAVLDNGVNYTLPAFEGRLARRDDGTLIGHDYWEDDDRPFDFGYPPQGLDPRLSAFSPRHHGTGVASVLMAEAPAQACLGIYRYVPAPVPGRDLDVSKILDDMARDGIRVVNVSSGRQQPWPEFEKAIAAHPDILFVFAAGNDGADLQARPYYPASYEAANVVVVAAADDRGQLWDRSNRGPVDVAAPAVDVRAQVADGSERPLTGTSIAAPRVAALAARLMAASPGMTAAAAKEGIAMLAQTSGVVADGIPVLTDEVLQPR